MKAKALIELIREARRGKASQTAYRRAVKNMDILEIPREEREAIITELELDFWLKQEKSAGGD